MNTSPSLCKMFSQYNVWQTLHSSQSIQSWALSKMPLRSAIQSWRQLIRKINKYKRSALISNNLTVSIIPITRAPLNNQVRMRQRPTKTKILLVIIMKVRKKMRHLLVNTRIPIHMEILQKKIILHQTILQKQIILHQKILQQQKTQLLQHQIIRLYLKHHLKVFQDQAWRRTFYKSMFISTA